MGPLPSSSQPNPSPSRRPPLPCPARCVARRLAKSGPRAIRRIVPPPTSGRETGLGPSRAQQLQPGSPASPVGSGRAMTKVPAFAKAFAGGWRIVEMDTWDNAVLDLVEEAHITFTGASDGNIVFGA